MDAELERLSSEIVRIVDIILNPATSPSDRKIAHEYFENVKETSPLCAKCGFFLIARSNSHAIRHCAFQLIEHHIKFRWNNIDDNEKIWIKNSTMETLASGIGPVNEEEQHVKDAVAKIVVEIIKREWPQQWTSLMDELDSLCRLGDTQIELVLLIFSRLADDIVQFQNVPEKRRKEIYTTLCSYLHDMFEFFLNTLSENSEKYLIKKHFNIKGTETLINCRLARVTLDTLCAFVDWVHIDHVTNGPLISILCKLIGSPDLRLDAAKCLFNALDRKGKNEDKKQLLILFEEKKLFDVISTLDMLNEDEYLFFKIILQCLLAMVSHLIACMVSFSVEVPSNFPLFLSCVMKFTRHPSVVLSQIAQTIWTNILRCPHLSSNEMVHSLIPTLLKYETEKLIRCGYPSKNDCLSSKYSILEFDSDEEFEVAYYKCRADVAENLRLITKILPKVSFSLGDALLTALLNGEDFKSILDNPIAKTDSEECWETIIVYMDAVCGSLTKNTEIPAVKELANDALRLLNAVLDSNTDRCGVRSAILSCISSLFYFVTFQPELKSRIYTKMFSYLTCTADNTNSRELVNLKRHSTSLLIKFSLFYPNLLLPDFDYLCNQVQALLPLNIYITRFEKCALLESLLILSNSFHDFERQSNFLKAALSFVDPIWANPVIVQAIQSPEAFISLLGIDKPCGNENPINENAADLMFASNITRACIKRCIYPRDPEVAKKGNFIHPLSDSTEGVFYRNPAAECVICVMDKVIQIIKILNVLHDPVVKQTFHSDYSKVLNLTEIDPNNVIVPPLIPENPNIKTPFARMKNYLQQLNENMLYIIGSSAENLGIDFYNFPNIFSLVKENIFYKCEYMTLLHLKHLIRNFLRPFFINCPPKAYDELIKLLAVFCPFMLQKLNTVWDKFKLKYGTSMQYDGQMTENEEILEDQLNRVLTKEYMCFLECLLTQSYTSPVKENKMESDQREPSNVNSYKIVTELGLKIIQAESVRVVFICTVFDSLRWLDTTANNKASVLAGIVFHLIIKEKLLREVPEADYLVQSVLYSLQEFGEHEANLSLLLNLGVSIYEGLRNLYPAVRSKLMTFVNCSEESILKLDDILNKTMPKAKKEKQKKDAFKNIIQNIIGRNIGQRHKKNIEIKNLPSLIRLKTKTESSFPEFCLNEEIGIFRIFGAC